MVLLLAFITPIVLNVRENNKIQKALVLRLNNVAIENGVKIQKFETWRHRYAIALDAESKKLIYINTGAENQELCINLNNINSVTIHEKHHLSGVGKDSYKVIDNFDLILGSPHENLTLCFYDSDIFSDIQNEKPLIEEWHLHIKQLIPKMPERKTPIIA